MKPPLCQDVCHYLGNAVVVAAADDDDNVPHKVITVIIFLFLYTIQMLSI
jgi:hypothetical protein